jgi:uncharacterized membrane protein
MFKTILDKKNNIFFILLYVGSLVLANLMYLFRFNALGIDTFIWLICLIPLFGSLIIYLTSIIKKITLSEFLSYSISFSILAIILIGLCVDIAGLIIKKPTLRPDILLPVFDSIYVTLVFICLLKNKGKNLSTNILTNTKPKIIIQYLVVLILPIMSVFGAEKLNNTGSDSLAIVTLLLIFIFAITIIIRKSDLPSSFYAISAWSMCSALLLGFSMRSNYLYGFDIHQEYQVFSSTVQNGIWHPTLINAAYNACLSITIFPAFLHSFLRIQNLYVFKLVAPLLFSTIAIVIYNLFLRQLKNKKHAFLLVFFFIAQTQFISEFPGLVRQQFALLFFALLLSATFLDIRQRTKTILIIVFGGGMILSHYSTTYVCLALLVLAYLLKKLYLSIQKKYKQHGVNKALYEGYWDIKPSLILILLISSFLWYGLVSNISSGLKSAIDSSVTSFSSFFEANSRSAFILNTVGIGEKPVTTKSLLNLANTRRLSDSYSFEQYTPQPTYTSDPSPRNQVQLDLSYVYNYIMPTVVKLILVTGVIYTVIVAFAKKNNINYAMLISAASVLFVVLVLLPNISQFYNIERYYQQILIIVLPSFFVGLSYIVHKVKSERIITLVAAIVIFAYTLATTGIALLFTYGSPYIDISDNNSTYDRYYTTAGEVDSLNWLANNRQSNYNIPDEVNLDRYSDLNAIAYDPSLTSNSSIGLLPTQITGTSYVYASIINIKGYVFDTYENNDITYTFPAALLNQNKDILYSNSDSEVYH